MSSTSPPKRMRHGLTSRAHAEERIYEVVDIAKLLSRPAPSCPMVFQAAMELTDAILHLSDVTRAQAALLTLGGPGGGTDAASGDDVHASEAMSHARTFLGIDARRWRALEGYTRKARSRRDRLIRRLDHLVLEARRREREEQACLRALSGKFGPF